MDTYETLLTRRSCRAYDPDRPVDRETLEKVVEAGRFPPAVWVASPSTSSW